MKVIQKQKKIEKNVLKDPNILQMKESIANSGEAPTILSGYFKIVKQLSFEERPDYNKLVELFSEGIEEEQKKKVTN